MECIKVNKKTKARLFENISIGDVVKFSVPMEAVGGRHGRSYAVYIKCVNASTGETADYSFNEIGKVIECFEWKEAKK